MGTKHFFLLSAFLYFTTEAPSPKSDLVLFRNKRNVKSRAELRSCKRHNCSNTACSNKDGWQLYGSDWGCCGNYDGCCTWASVICYAHDVICQCCDYGWWCGPDCRREPECFLPGRKIPDRYGVWDHSMVNQIPDSMTKNVFTANTKGAGQRINQEKQNKTGQRNTIPKETFTNVVKTDQNSRLSQDIATEAKGENVSKNSEKLAKNETGTGSYVYNMTQKLNSSTITNNGSYHSSFIGSEANVDNDNAAIEQNGVSVKTNNQSQYNKDKSGKTTILPSERLPNGSLETNENTEEVNDTRNGTQSSNFSRQDGDFNSTVTSSQEDNNIHGNNQSAVEDNDEVAKVNTEDAFQNVIHVARTSSSSDTGDSLLDNVTEEDGSGMV